MPASTLDTILGLFNRMNSTDGQVERFSYKQAAFDTDEIEGTASFDITQDNNIPLLSLTDYSSDLIDNGARTQAASIPRMAWNHFLGRMSYNINKTVQQIVAFFTLELTVWAHNAFEYDATQAYATGDTCYLISTVGPMKLSTLYTRTGTSPATITGISPVMVGQTDWTIVNEGYGNWDLVIDSNAKLDLWCQHTGGLYKRVLIRAGTWTATALSPTAGVLVNLDNTGTIYVFAEKGAVVQFSGAYAGMMYGLYHASVTTNYTVERFENVRVTLTNTTSNQGSTAFYNCTNLTVCGASATGSGTGIGYGFSNCINLVDCTGASNSTGSGNSYAFYSCSQVLGCYGTGTSSSGAGYGFFNGTQMANCTGIGTGTAGGFGNSCTIMITCIGTGQGNIPGWDLVIDSNAKLDLWCQHTGGLYKRVLVMAGTWTASALSPTAGVLINLDNTGTVYVFAEKGSSIVYSGSLAAPMYGLYHATQPSDLTKELFANLKINLTNAVHDASAFYKCTNLQNCSGIAATSSIHTAYGFNTCNVLYGCTASTTNSVGGAAGFSSCNNLSSCGATTLCTSTGTSYGFSACNNLSNCTATTNNYPGGTGNSYGFISCTELVTCAAVVTTDLTGIAYGFNGCSYVLACTSVTTANGSASAFGFWTSNNVSNCESTAVSITGTAYGYWSCVTADNCVATATGSVNGYGFYSCTQLANCSSTGSTSTSGGYGDNCNYLSNCIGNGQMIGYTPTVTAGSGSISLYSVISAAAIRDGCTVFFEVVVDIITNGSGSGNLQITLPFACGRFAYMICGRENALVGKILQGQIPAGSTVVVVMNYDNSYPAANGAQIIISGTYSTD